MKKKKSAFTLAEVLIALTVIGIVSALTIPVLMQKTNKQEYVSALQKAYSVLSQATNSIIAEEGSPKADDGGWASSAENMYELYKKHLNNAKDCGTDAGCFGQISEEGAKYYKYLTSGKHQTDWNSSSFYKLILADGMQVNFSPYQLNSNCKGSANGAKDTCARIFVDINGAKAPNTFGRDTFVFVVKETGLYPSGCDSDSCIGTIGWGCACKVISEGRMDY